MTETNSAVSTRFPYATLAAVLEMSFALGCVITVLAGDLLKPSGTPTDRDYVSLGLLAFATVMILAGIAVQISLLVERTDHRLPVVAADATTRASPSEICTAAAGIDAHNQAAPIPQEGVPLAAGTTDRAERCRPEPHSRRERHPARPDRHKSGRAA